MVVVGLDTNALMMPVECDISVFEELDRLFGLDVTELVVPSAVLDELNRLESGSDEAATAASVGKDIAGRCRVVETNVSYADDAIVELATDGELDYVVTNDAPLRDRLRSHGVHVVSRQGETTLGIRSP